MRPPSIAALAAIAIAGATEGCWRDEEPASADGPAVAVRVAPEEALGRSGGSTDRALEATVASQAARIATLEARLAESQKARDESAGALAAEVEAIRTELSARRETLDRYERMIKDLARHSPIPNFGAPSVPKIEARVLSVRPTPEGPLVLLDAGTDRGVQRGYEFAVRRNGMFVAKLAVDEVRPAVAGARLIYAPSGDATLREGDVATTRIDEP